MFWLFAGLLPVSVSYFSLFCVFETRLNHVGPAGIKISIDHAGLKLIAINLPLMSGINIIFLISYNL